MRKPILTEGASRGLAEMQSLATAQMDSETDKSRYPKGCDLEKALEFVDSLRRWEKERKEMRRKVVDP